MQWGEANGSTSSPTTTFPISFTSAVYRIVNTHNRNSTIGDTYQMNECIPKNITRQGFTIWVDNGTPAKFDYISIGYQQWGYNSNNAAGATTGFPISFTSACYGVVHCSGNTGRVEGNPYISSLTKSQINWGQYGLGYWIAFGL